MRGFTARYKHKIKLVVSSCILYRSGNMEKDRNCNIASRDVSKYELT